MPKSSEKSKMFDVIVYKAILVIIDARGNYINYNNWLFLSFYSNKLVFNF